MQILAHVAGVEDIWQLHWAFAAGLEQNTPGLFIATSKTMRPSQRFAESSAHIWAAPRPGRPRAPGARKEHTARHSGSRRPREADGTFSVTNTRNNFTKTYVHGERRAARNIMRVGAELVEAATVGAHSVGVRHERDRLPIA